MRFGKVPLPILPHATATELVSAGLVPVHHASSTLPGGYSRKGAKNYTSKSVCSPLSRLP